jgi:hypothetical protein
VPSPSCQWLSAQPNSCTLMMCRRVGYDSFHDQALRTAASLGSAGPDLEEDRLRARARLSGPSGLGDPRRPPRTRSGPSSSATMATGSAPGSQLRTSMEPSPASGTSAKWSLAGRLGGSQSWSST